MKRIAMLVLAGLLSLSLCASAHPGKRLKNIIIMISDGCGYNHVDAASMYQYGATGVQVYESFPVRCAMAHYPGSSWNTPGGPMDGSYDPIAAWTYFLYVKSNPTDE